MTVNRRTDTISGAGAHTEPGTPHFFHSFALHPMRSMRDLLDTPFARCAIRPMRRSIGAIEARGKIRRSPKLARPV
jgi:hypothetical protein